ncbi:MAG: N-acetylmuramoyl-L-alanine amidase [Elusimicrobiota bacterium]|jgi:N-acetylmuramoyl-L-alanine amidase
MTIPLLLLAFILAPAARSTETASAGPSSGTFTVNGATTPRTGLGQFLPVEPRGDLIVKPGDWVRAAAWAQPGGVMTFRIKGLTNDLPMTEDPGQDPGGYYTGAWRVVALDAAPDKAKPRELEFSFRHPEHGKARGRAPGRVTAAPGFWRAARVSAKLAATRSGAEAGQLYFFQQGTRILLDGRSGSSWRIRLAGAEEAWIDDKDIELLPEGTPPTAAKLETIVVRSSDTHANVEFSVGTPVPVVVSQEAAVVRVSFYGVRPHVNWVVYDDNDSFVREVRWRSENSERTDALIHLREGERLWGYALRRTGERWVLTLRRAPRAGRRSLFEGITVVLDPGPSGSDLAGIGPQEALEQDVDLSLARRVRDRLLAEKASVVLTRESADEVVPLARRTEIAVERQGDVFLSLHVNALSPGATPLAAPGGFSMFHHQPQSVELSRELQLSYRSRIPLPSDGMRFADLHVIRLTEMPSVLLEPGAAMLPESKALIRDPKFQDKLSQAIVEGLWKFLRKNLREPAKAPPRPASGYGG